MLEDVVKQIRALLQNQLPGKLRQIELERADGVVLEDVQGFYAQEWPKDVHLKHPAIILLGLKTNATNILSRRRELRHRILSWVIDRVVSPGSELSQTRLWRYVEAVERILASDPTLGGKVVDSTVISHQYLPKEAEEFVRRALLTLEVWERPSTNNY